VRGSPAVGVQALPLGPHRYRLLDLLRGLALYAMAVYHLAWDLLFLGLADIPVASGTFWLWFRAAIISSFLLLVGVSLVLVCRTGLDWKRHLVRVSRLVAAAAAVSLATLVIAPANWVFFGVLHCIAAASLLLLPAVRLPAAGAAVLGIAVIIADRFGQPLFDAPWLWWVGLGTFMPATLDYVPLFPWFGPVLLGIALGHGLFPRQGGSRLPDWAPRGALGRATAWCGHHSLLFYLLHQPVLLAILYAWTFLQG